MLPSTTFGRGYGMRCKDEKSVTLINVDDPIIDHLSSSFEGCAAGEENITGGWTHPEMDQGKKTSSQVVGPTQRWTEESVNC